MKNTLKHFFCFILLFGITFSDAASLNYATWNLRWPDKRDIASGDTWDKRVKPIADVIGFYDFDIIGLQEARASQINDLFKYLNQYDVLQIDSLEDNPILLKKGTFKILEQGRFYLSKTPSIQSKSWDATLVRFCTWVKLEKEGKNFFVFNVHFDYRGKKAQFESAKLMIKKIKEIAKDSPFILSGDFNFIDKTESYKMLATNDIFRDAKKIATITYLPNGSYDYFDTQKFSPWQFDHIFVDKSIKVSRYGILNETYYDGSKFRYPSDHLPITIFLEF